MLTRGITLKILECFDPESDVWTELNDMPSPVDRHSLVPYGNKLLLIGGWDGKTCLNSTLELSNLEGKGAWKELPPMKYRRVRFSSAILNNEIFVIGGKDGAMSAINKTEIFDGKSWRDGPLLHCECFDMPSVVIPPHLVSALHNYRQ